MKNKSRLDEHQEQVLLGIESRGCWFAFWALLVAIIAQSIIYGFEATAKAVAGEWIVFMCLSLYLSIACMKNGIWDRKHEANPKTNAGFALAAAVISGIVFAVIKLREYPDKPVGCVATGVFIAVLVFALTFAALQVSAKTYKKRLRELEKEQEEDISNEEL